MSHKHETPLAPRLKLYVGCSLTLAPAEFVSAVEALKTKLGEEYEMLEFYGLTNGAPEGVYQWDIHNNIATCDLFVAICDHPSTGLGYELASAVEHFKKPVLAVAHTDTHVTRMIEGVQAPGYSFVRYQSLDEIPDLVRAKLSHVNQ